MVSWVMFTIGGLEILASGGLGAEFETYYLSSYDGVKASQQLLQ